MINLTKIVTFADSLNFEAGKTQTITNNLTLNGTGGGFLALRSTFADSYWYIDPQGTRNISFVDVKDSNNSNIVIIVPVDSVDSLNNINWSFIEEECL